MPRDNCARCGATPYYSVTWQRHDWSGLHRSVCHNLARRLSVLDVTDSPRAAVEPIVPCPAPLRRPRSPAQEHRSIDDSRSQRDNHELGRPARDNNESFRSQRDNPESARPQRDNHELGRPARDNNESFRPQRDNHEARNARDNYESFRPVRDNQSSRPPMPDNQESARPQRDKQEAPRPARDNYFQRRDERDERRLPRDNDQSGSDRFNNKNMDNNRGGRGGRGRNFMPRNGEMRRPNFANNSPQESPRDQLTNGYSRQNDYAHQHYGQSNKFRGGGNRSCTSDDDHLNAQEKPNRDWESNKPHAIAPPGVAPTAQVFIKPEVKPDEPKRDEPKKEVKPLLTVADATPVKKMIPMKCLIETLSVGDTFLLSVDAKTADCRVDTAGFVCLSVHAGVEAVYEALCEPFSEACDKEPAHTPSPGEAFALFSKEENAWYRARLLAPNLAALIDSSRVINIATNEKCHKLPAAYQTQPEFSCVLQSDKATLEQSLQATITSKTPIVKVTLVDAATGGSIGDGTVARWLPKVDYPKAEPKPAASANEDNKSKPIPVVSRPDIKNNSRVFLVDCTGFGAAYVRPCEMNEQRAFDIALQETALYALKAKPLTEPPAQGSVVISKFTDGNHYRALVKRTSKERNRYQLEYLEFGNIHVNQLENLYACPPELNIQARPVVTSLVTIGPEDVTFTPPALEYIETLKDTAELLLTADSGAVKVPSGSTVNLIVIKGNVNLNTRLQEMCKPEWKKMEEAGGDVVEVGKIMFTELEFVKLPTGACELDILDISYIQMGIVNGCPLNLQHAKYVLTTLTDKMGDYCNSALGRDPYLPRDEELCIAQMPPYEQWFRAVKIEQKIGANTAVILYVDYGTLRNDVPVSLLRKMLPEFVRGLPAIGVTIHIKDFPKEPTDAQLAAALQYMKVDDEGRGRLLVTRCDYIEEEVLYTVTAPGLIDAMRQA